MPTATPSKKPNKKQRKNSRKAVEALQKLFINTYQPAQGRDSLCYRYNVLSESWGKDVLTRQYFSGINGYTSNTLTVYLSNYHFLEKAFYGAMAGEKQ